MDSYTVKGHTEGTVGITYQIVVPEGATMDDLQRWYDELQQQGHGKRVMVNFYDGTTSSSDSLIASCEGEQCTIVRYRK